MRLAICAKRPMTLLTLTVTYAQPGTKDDIHWTLVLQDIPPRSLHPTLPTTITMGVSYIKLLGALIWFTLSYLQQVSASALPIESHNPPGLFPPSLDSHRENFIEDDGLKVSQVVTYLLRQLALQPDIRFRQALLVGIFLRVSPGDPPSNNIADFHSIGCIFLYGGDAPPSGKSNAFAIGNQWPEHWEEWNNQVVPRLIPADFEAIQWQKSQALMSVEKADYLLKAAGYIQRYRGVVMLKLAKRPLGYCFSKVDDLRNVNVDVSTGRVSEVRDCSVSM